MAKPKLAIRPVEKNISLPQTIVARIDLELFSKLENRVPHGAWSRLVVQLLRQHIDTLPSLADEVTPE